LDRKPTVASFLILALAALALAGATADNLSMIHADRWLAPGADRARALGSVRAECLSGGHDAQATYLIEVGRAAFRTPMLLGGQAARAGLACESCHQGGRSNPDFFFPGLSGAPGTADVTTSLFSTHRDDRIDNPRPIPDLTSLGEQDRIAHNLAGPALAQFIHGQITEEFEGAEPPPAVLAGLAAYVRALSTAACPADPRRPLTPATYADNAQRAVRAAAAALDRKDPATAALMLEAARAQLGLIYERYDQPVSARSRALLHAASFDLAAAQDAVRARDPRAGDRLAVWQARAPAWAGVLEQQAPQSLFSTARLTAAGAH
jgi:hypothetical protein